MRVLVTGGRDFADRAYVAQALGLVCLPGDVLVHGAARGADSLAAEWALANGLTVEAHPADWDLHGRAAGHVRNQEMLDSGVDVLVAMPGGRGTADMVRRALLARLPVVRDR